MVQRIKYELKLEIMNSWMDDASKQTAIKVLTDLSFYISKLNFPTLRSELPTTSYDVRFYFYTNIILLKCRICSFIYYLILNVYLV